MKPGRPETSVEYGAKESTLQSIHFSRGTGLRRLGMSCDSVESPGPIWRTAALIGRKASNLVGHKSKGFHSLAIGLQQALPVTHL